MTAEEEAQRRRRHGAIDVADRAVRELHRRPRAPRVRQPVGDRAHDDRDQPQRRRRAQPDARARQLRLLGRRRLGPAAAAQALRRRRLLGRHHASTAPRRPSPGCRRTTSTASSGPTPRTSSSIRRGPRSPATPGSLAFRKISGARVRFESNVGFKSPGFDSNDLGFIRRADQITQSNWLQWRHDKPGKYIRSFRFNLNQWGGHNFDGDRLCFGGNVNAHWTFKNNWSTGFGINRERGQLRRPRDARRAGRQLRRHLELLELRQHRRPQAGRVRHLPRRRLVGVRAALLRRQPGRDLPARCRRCR